MQSFLQRFCNVFVLLSSAFSSEIRRRSIPLSGRRCGPASAFFSSLAPMSSDRFFFFSFWDRLFRKLARRFRRPLASADKDTFRLGVGSLWFEPFSCRDPCAKTRFSNFCASASFSVCFSSRRSASSLWESLTSVLNVVFLLSIKLSFMLFFSDGEV